MKPKITIILSTLFFWFMPYTSCGQDIAVDKDVASVDAIIYALYASISGEKGEPRDWDRFNKLFVDDAKLIPTGKGKDGNIGLRSMSPKAYIETANDYLMNNGFYENEIFRVTESYGNIIHLFSTYESRNSKADEKPFSRGINSIQLLNDGKRYWIVSVYWMAESTENPIPEKYLPQ